MKRIGIGAGFAVWGMVMCSACASPAPIGVLPARDSLRGKTGQAVVACAGAPLERVQERDLTVLIYHKDAGPLEESFPASKGSVPVPRHACRARVTLQQDRVVGVEYQGTPPSVDAFDHCEEIFARCAQ